VHGANRLGGNGVANSTVFGGIAGDTMGEWIRHEKAFAAPDQDAIAASIADHEKPFAGRGRGLEQVRDGLYNTMWNKVGILRNASDLGTAQGDLDALSDELAAIGVADQNRAYNLTWHDWMTVALTSAKISPKHATSSRLPLRRYALSTERWCSAGRP